jgi:6-pyruvoyltetrahydropterin/6-carboxytetrahydropterin synthase
MGVHEASLTLTFSYGHRIRGHEGRCAHLHGHNGRVEFVCRGDLDHLGMVIDFARIREAMEGWILANWDHRMILQRDDPMLATLDEAGEPTFAIDNPPTAENMAAHLCGVARDAGLPIRAVRLWETEVSMGSFGAEDA